MKFRRLYIFLFYFLFWLVFFEIARLYFILFNLSETNGLGFWSIVKTFYFGLRLDLSIVSYISFFSVPIFLISAFFKSPKVLKISLGIYTGILLAAFSIIVIGDAEVYKYWGFRIDDTPLQYMNTPGVMKASTTNLRLAFLAFLYLDLALGSYFIYHIMVVRKMKKLIPEKFYAALFLLIAGVLIIPIRGGIGIVPLNAGAVYHSDNMFLNHAAINVVWNSGSSLFADDIDYDAYRYFDKDERDTYFAKAHESPDSTIKVINGKPKHIVVIVLESFTKNAVNFSNPQESVTPKLVELSKEGILFDNFYANGDRSEKGIVSIFSSTPTLPSYSVMKDPEKSRHLPSLAKELLNNGYKTSFYYGGDINFANMQSYLKQSGFQNIIALNNLDLDCEETKWGYHDEYMFDKFYSDIQEETDSSFNVFFTLSSHEPYDVPGKKPYGEKSEHDKCRNAYYYTDSCLNDFIINMKNSPKWDNTLIILVPDHGTRYPGNVNVWDLPKFQIFMMWLGGAIDCDPFVYDQTGDQSDISATLLGQLDIDYSNFPFSENMLSKYQANVFYAFNHGYAYVKGVRWVIYDINADKVLYRGWDSEGIENHTKAYAQTLAEYYETLGQ